MLKKTEDFTVNAKNQIKTTCRSSVITPKFVGLTLQVHNGKTFIHVKIIEEMINYKLGEFACTRKQFFYKKKNK